MCIVRKAGTSIYICIYILDDDDVCVCSRLCVCERGWYDAENYIYQMEGLRQCENTSSPTFFGVCFACGWVYACMRCSTKTIPNHTHTHTAKQSYIVYRGEVLAPPKGVGSPTNNS